MAKGSTAAATALLLLLLPAVALAAYLNQPVVNYPDGTVAFGDFTGFSGNHYDGSADLEIGSQVPLAQLTATGVQKLLQQYPDNVVVIAISVDASTGNLYVGGSISSYVNQAINNIAQYENGALYPLDQGLNGVVYDLIAYNGTVYATGSFTGPVGLYYTYFETTTTMGNIAKFSNGLWSAMPALGLTSAGTLLALSGDTLYVVSQSESTGDFDSSPANPVKPAIDQWISQSFYFVATSPNATGYTPSLVLSSGNDSVPSSCYTLPQLTSGALQIDLGVLSPVYKIRIANLLDGNGTATFHILDDSNNFIQLYYFSPLLRTQTSCTACPLFNVPGRNWTDFYVNGDITRTLTVELLANDNGYATYGNHAGLCGIEVFRKQLMATPKFNANGTTFTTDSSSNDWSLSGLVTDLVGQFAVATIAATGSPYLTVSFENQDAGNYEILIDGVACVDLCVGNATVVISGVNATTQTYTTVFSQDIEFNLINLANGNTYVPLPANATIVIKPTGSIGEQLSINAVILNRVPTIIAPTSFLFAYDLIQGTVVSIPMIAPPVTADAVSKILPVSQNATKLYIAGSFAGGITELDVTTGIFSSLPNGGLGGAVYDAVYLQDGSLLVGGSFDNILYDGTLLDSSCLARLVDGNWTSFGIYGTPGYVNSLAVVGNTVYVVGGFSEVIVNQADLPLYRPLAAFDIDTNTWDNSGFTTVSFSEVYTDGTNVYYINSAGEGSVLDLAAVSVAKFDASANAWTTVNEGFWFLGGQVNSAIFIDGDLYVAGNFDVQGSIYNTLSNVAVLSSVNNMFVSIGGGVNDEVFALADVNDQLWVGGSFTAALPSLQPNETPVPAPGIAIWSGSNWTYPAGGFLASSSGSAITVNVIYNPGWSYGVTVVAGTFTYCGPSLCNNIAINDGNQWWSLAGGVNGAVNAIAHINNLLLVGGSFDYVGNMYSEYLALYDLDIGRWSLTQVFANQPVLGLAVSNNDFSGLAVLLSGVVYVDYYEYTEEYSPGVTVNGYSYNNAFYFANGAASISYIAASNAQDGNVLQVCGSGLGYQFSPSGNGYACIIYDGANWFPQLQVASGSIQGVAVPPSSPGLSFAGMVAIAAVFSVVGAALIAGIIYFLYKKCGGAAKQTAGKTSKAAEDKKDDVLVGAAVATGAVVVASRDNKKDVPLTDIKSTVSLGEYRATQAFTAQDSGELSLKANDLVSVFDTSNQDWWHGEIKGTGQRGWFPKGFVEPVAQQPGQQSAGFEKEWQE